MKEIKLTQGKVTLVDDEDYEYLNQWKWCAARINTIFYAVRHVGRRGAQKTILMHRIILNIPYNMQVDHIDHNGLNNQRYNIRAATSQQNSFNRSPIGRSMYHGVCVFDRGRRTFIAAAITYNGKKIYLGRFKTEEAAAVAYNEAASIYHGEYANLNKVLL